MALMARSIEMSFSASRLRSALRSISIGSLLVCALVVIVRVVDVVDVVVISGGVDPRELDLYLARAEVTVAKLAAFAFDVDRDRVGAGPGDSALDHACRRVAL